MMLKRLLCTLLILSGLNPLAAYAAIIKLIHIQGLQKIEKATVLSYLPVQVGTNFSPADSIRIIHALYATGFFQDIKVEDHSGNLFITVVERPTIASLQIKGNKDITRDKLLLVLKSLGIAEGLTFDESSLVRAEKGLQNEYYSQGKYNAKITSGIVVEPRNRVALTLNISEGIATTIRHIQIIGNQAYPKKALLKVISLSPANLFSYFTHDNRYSKDKLNRALEALTDYYLDKGFIRFKVESSQALLTPDKQSVTIIIRINEGAQYKISGYKFIGNKLLTDQELEKLIQFKVGDIFSRQTAVDISKAIGRALGNQGYAFANVNIVPEINDLSKSVYLSFYISPGKRVYIRRINFIGNTKTKDEVLRRGIQQMEAAPVAIDQIEQAKRQLNLLGYLENVDLETHAVIEADDQIDLEYHITEGPSAQATAGLGYTSGNGGGIVFNAGINQSNFLGTGKAVGVNLDTSRVNKNYNISYNDPFYTRSGIQRGFNLYLQKVDPANANIATYATNTYGGTVNYSLPVWTADNSIQLGLGYQTTVLNLGSQPSLQMIRFINDFGRHFNQLLINGGWSHNGFDRAIFPTNGLKQSIGIQISAPGGGPALDYYKLNYDAVYYHALTHNFGIVTHTGAGYGGGYGTHSRLPFFENYYAGGIGYPGAVRGFETYSLGPRDSANNPLGGDIFIAGSLGLIFPNPVATENLRTSLFIDAGNAYNVKPVGQLGRGAGPVRFSTGLSIEWRLGMLGVLDFNLAKPMNKQLGDKAEFFQFAVGTSF